MDTNNKQSFMGELGKKKMKITEIYLQNYFMS